MVGLPFTDPVESPAVVEPQLKISVEQESSGGLGGAAGLASDLLGNNEGPDPWLTHLMQMKTELRSGAQVSHATLFVADSETAPEVSLGDTLKLELGYGDSGSVPFFKGSIEKVESSIDGYKRVVVVSPLIELAKKRINQSFEEQSAGDVVNSLAGETSIETDNVESGNQYPFLVVSDRQSLLEHIHAIARQQNWLCYDGPEGKLNAHKLTAGEVAKTFAYGSDVMELHHWKKNSGLEGAKVIGSGAATSNGSSAWSWLTKEPKVVSESGTGIPVVPSRALRDNPGAQGMLDRLLAEDQQKTNRVRIKTGAAPEVRVGSLFEITEAPNDANGRYFADQIILEFDRENGFVSIVEGFSESASSGGLGGLGGLL